MNSTVWLIGAGTMAVEYAKVLTSLNANFIAIGRGQINAQLFKEKTGCDVITGGLQNFLNSKLDIPDYAIVATGVESLAETTIQLINLGVRFILCEKPGGINQKEVEFVSKLAGEKKVKVVLAYNRRFYASVRKAKEIIDSDGGVSSYNFEFTEWAHVIAPLQKGLGVKENWFLANSTHVVDLAFFLGGQPKELSSYKTGGLDWHPASSNFAGAGISKNGALFSYIANWESPGRWAVEFLTKNYRLILKPLEKLQLQKKGSIQIDFVEIDDTLDKSFKPGLYLQTKSFLTSNHSEFISVQDQLQLMPIYKKISGEE